MGDGPVAAAPGADRAATPVSPPRTGVALFPGSGPVRDALARSQTARGSGVIAPGLAQQAFEQRDRSRLGQRLVPVPALGGLDAGGAARAPPAGHNCLTGGAP